MLYGPGFGRPKLQKFLVRLVYLSQQRSARHANDRMPWQAPTQLLDDLETHRFRSLGVVGAEV